MDKQRDFLSQRVKQIQQPQHFRLLNGVLNVGQMVLLLLGAHADCINMKFLYVCCVITNVSSKDSGG